MSKLSPTNLGRQISQKQSCFQWRILGYSVLLHFGLFDPLQRHLQDIDFFRRCHIHYIYIYVYIYICIYLAAAGAVFLLLYSTVGS